MLPYTACFMILRFVRCLARHDVRPAHCSVPFRYPYTQCVSEFVCVSVCVCMLYYVVLCCVVMCCAVMRCAMLCFLVFITMPISKINTKCWSDRYDTAEGDEEEDRSGDEVEDEVERIKSQL